MTLQDEYTTTARRAQDAWVNAAESWTGNITKATDEFRLPATPVVTADPSVAVERYFEFLGRLLEANREYAKNLAGAADAFGGAVRQHVESITGIVRDQVQVVSETAKEQVENLEQVQREEAERAEQAEREQARQARQAERQQAREARQAARERYEGLTKAQLVEELGKRDLPKTGNVDELVERLVDADTE
jgi:hypothetical protein